MKSRTIFIIYLISTIGFPITKCKENLPCLAKKEEKIEPKIFLKKFTFILSIKKQQCGIWDTKLVLGRYRKAGPSLCSFAKSRQPKPRKRTMIDVINQIQFRNVGTEYDFKPLQTSFLLKKRKTHFRLVYISVKSDLSLCFFFFFFIFSSLYFLSIHFSFFFPLWPLSLQVSLRLNQHNTSPKFNVFHFFFLKVLNIVRRDYFLFFFLRGGG